MINRASEKDKNNFNEKAVHPLQTWEWGEFRRQGGNKVIRFTSSRNDKIINSYQLLIHSVPGIPYKIGSLIRGASPTKELTEILKSTAKDEKLLFIKLEPNILSDQNTIDKLKSWGYSSGKTLFTPTSFWIDLTPTEEDLLKSFQSKTRYNIRLSKRKGVTVSENNSKKAFEKYIALTRETVERQKFHSHTESYHRRMWKMLHLDMIKNNKKPIARLLTARYKGKIITCWMVFVWKNFLYYPYGASTHKHKNVMANNLMMWEAIRYGKALGLKTFDLWGREEGKGFTRFKEGYNPKVVKFIGTWDLITSPLYPLYRLLETFRWSLLKTKSKFTTPTF
ncbi:lipid II:glycine glycyltransferase FemX [Patescibacteria group bacterium]